MRESLARGGARINEEGSPRQKQDGVLEAVS